MSVPAALDRRARARIARLLAIGDIEAGVVLRLAGGGHATLGELQVGLGLSPGGAASLVDHLEHEALVRRESDPLDPSGVRVRLSPAAEVEVGTALRRLAGRLGELAEAFPPFDRR